jgi:hypothetical protein
MALFSRYIDDPEAAEDVAFTEEEKQLLRQAERAQSEKGGWGSAIGGLVGGGLGAATGLFTAGSTTLPGASLGASLGAGLGGTIGSFLGQSEADQAEERLKKLREAKQADARKSTGRMSAVAELLGQYLPRGMV